MLKDDRPLGALNDAVELVVFEQRSYLGIIENPGPDDAARFLKAACAGGVEKGFEVREARLVDDAYDLPVDCEQPARRVAK